MRNICPAGDLRVQWLLTVRQTQFRAAQQFKSAYGPKYVLDDPKRRPNIHIADWARTADSIGFGRVLFHEYGLTWL